MGISGIPFPWIELRKGLKRRSYCRAGPVISFRYASPVISNGLKVLTYSQAPRLESRTAAHPEGREYATVLL
jgi:hypothetical protein